MKKGLLVAAFIFVAACGGGEKRAPASNCAQWKDVASCTAHSACTVNSCPDCNGDPSFINCTDGVGISCPAQWLSGCCQTLTTDAACKALGGCYSTYDSSAKFEACYGGQPVCTTTNDCANALSCSSGFTPTSGSNYPGGNPSVDAGGACRCVESSLCAPDM